LGQICPDSYGSFKCVETPAQAIARMNGGENMVVVQEGCTIDGTSTESFAGAVAAAASVDTAAVVMVMGLDTLSVEKEGHDRTAIGLPGVQLELIQMVVSAVRAQKPLIVVMLNGGAVTLDWLKLPGNTDAIIEAFYPGKRGSEAIADALFGNFSPGGKLAYSVMPENYVKEVDFLNMSMTAGTGRTYRFYTGEPLWHFGYGLSYSTFSLQEDVVASQHLSLPAAYTNEVAPTYKIKVQNTGTCIADEVVQAYFEPVNVTVAHAAPLPRRQLFDFQRVKLAPGESTVVPIQVNSASLLVADAKGSLVSAPGEYNIVFTNGNDQSIVKKLKIDGLEQIVEHFPGSSEAVPEKVVFI